MKTDENSSIRDGHGGFFSGWVWVKSNLIGAAGSDMKYYISSLFFCRYLFYGPIE
jgi:hypothetical protein